MLISAETDVLALLANPVRARIVRMLADGPACTCDLVDDIGATQSNVSNHLRALRQSGLVVAEPRGRYTYYRLCPERLEAVAAWLVDLAAKARVNTSARRDC